MCHTCQQRVLAVMLGIFVPVLHLELRGKCARNIAGNFSGHNILM